MPRHARLAYALCLATWLPAAAWAYQPLISDDTGTQGSGGNQLELSYNHARSDVLGSVTTNRAIPFTYTRGLSDNLDLFAGVVRTTSPEHGWGNAGVGAKWRFYEDAASKLSLAVKPTVLLPVSAAQEARGLGLGKTSYGLAFIASKETGFGELHFNLAAERDNYADATTPDRRNLWRVSVAPVWALAKGFKVALDLGLQINPDPAEKSRMGYVELGLVYSPSEDLDLALGLTHDVMDGTVRSNYATLGVTWRFR